MLATKEFAHVFLFRCPECGRPLASACASTQSNLELADAYLFNPHCHLWVDRHHSRIDQREALRRALG
jgi:hypothetical protein